MLPRAVLGQPLLKDQKFSLMKYLHNPEQRLVCLTGWASKTNLKIYLEYPCKSPFFATVSNIVVIIICY